MKWYARMSYRQKCEIFGLLIATLSLFVLLSLVTHDHTDDWVLGATPEELAFDDYDYQVANAAGRVGAQVSLQMFEWFGLLSWIIVGILFLRGVSLIVAKPIKGARRAIRHAGVALLVLGLLWDLGDAIAGVAWEGGAGTAAGATGRLLAYGIGSVAGRWGATLLLLGFLLGYFAYATSWRPHLQSSALARRVGDWWANRRAGRSSGTTRGKKTGAPTEPLLRRLLTKTRDALAAFGLTATRGGEPTDSDTLARRAEEMLASDAASPTDPNEELLQPQVESTDTAEPRTARRPRKSKDVPRLVRPKKKHVDEDYQYPPLDLLDLPTPRVRRRADRIEQAREALRGALKTFGITIDGGRIESYPGPVITRFEFKPGSGIKVNQISSLADDLALAMQAQRVRIIAPIPGKSAVGIEIPNHEAETVNLRELLGSSTFTGSDAVLPIALGKDTQGAPMVVDLAGMPHLLIAGATGSGKSVCINAMITSLLYSHHPSELRFLFIDPKMLELSVYEKIPHLERPVVTRPKGAESVFGLAVREMEERYRLLAGVGVRNIVDYNERASGEGEPGLPFIVIVVDELADLMMSPSANNIENLITRIAQMARAVGIHLVLATQRPSVDVITGLIKANFSCRIAFQVASRVDSRTILDANGAEKLLGNGDMLFLAPGQPAPVRVHGGYISSQETTKVVQYFRELQLEIEKIANFDDENESGDNGAKSGDTDDADPLFFHAAEVVVRHKQGSVSLLQRRLGIGYQRAARLIDRLEEAGVVGRYDGSKAREVLWNRDKLEELAAKPVGT